MNFTVKMFTNQKYNASPLPCGIVLWKTGANVSDEFLHILSWRWRLQFPPKSWYGLSNWSVSQMTVNVIFTADGIPNLTLIPNLPF